MPTDSTRDWTALAARVAFGGFVVSLLFGLLLPMYTDELGWRMQLRAGIDGGFDRMINDICGPNTIIAPPWFMMPFRSVSAWLNLAFADPLYVRLMGVGSAIGWAFLLRALILRLAADPQQRSILMALTFALLGMGLLPIMLTMSRPDQVILLTTTAALLTATLASREAVTAPRWRRWCWPLLIVAIALPALSWHLKGILFAPLFLVCILFAGTAGHWRARIVSGLLFNGLAASAAHYWIARFRCPGDPGLAARLASENIASALAEGKNLGELIGIAIQGANPNHYIAFAELRLRVMSDWLPRDLISEAGAMIRYLPMNLAWNALMLIGVICLLRALVQRWRERRLDLGIAAPVVIAGLVLVWGMSQRVKNDYEIMTVMPMIALFGLFSLTAVVWTERRTRQLRLFSMALVAVSLIGQADLVRRLAPPLYRAAQTPGYVQGQNTSVSAYGYSAIRDQIRQTAKQCGIGANGRARHPLIDDVTYFAFADSWQPFHYLGVIGQWRGTISDPAAYLKSRGSEGMILGCHHLGPSLQGRAIRNGAFCCVSTR